MNTKTATDCAAITLTATLATLMASASIMFATAAGSGIDRYRGASLAILAHGASAAMGAGVLAVVTRRMASPRR